MAATGIHISISAEPLWYIGEFVVTNAMFTSVLVNSLLILFALIVNRRLKSFGKPQGLQNFAEWLVEQLHNLVHSVTGDLQKTRLFLPLISTFFIFILVSNWFGLLPGVHTIKLIVTPPAAEAVANQATQNDAAVMEDAEQALALGDASLDSELTSGGYVEENQKQLKSPLLRPGSADLNSTLALALVSVIATQFIGYHYLKFSYFKKFFNFSNPVMFFVGILELISEFAKIISFAFRLFGNIFAGEVLLVVLAFLVPLIIPMPFYGLELFIGFIQALVFAMLTLVFFNMATESHDDH